MHSNSTAPEQPAAPAASAESGALDESGAVGASAGPAAPVASAESSEKLGERIRDRATELAAPAAAAGECQDTASLITLPGLPLRGLLSDRTLKCDVLPVAWSR